MNTLINHSLSLLIVAALLSPKHASGQSGQENANNTNLSDNEIASAIEADIADASRIAGGEINVDASSGLVTLSGTATSLLDKRMADTIAKRTRGVTAVLNQLIVITSDRSDDDIRADVEKVLRINDSVDEPRIAIDVSGGEVALTGKVASLAEKRIAELAASGVTGVVKVDNQIAVSLSSDRTDKDIAEEIRGLIVHSVYLDDVQVDVRVEGHVAKLSGSAPSAETKDRLEQIAEIWGVSAVDVTAVKVDPNSADESQRRRRWAKVSEEEIQAAISRSFRNDPIVFSHVDAIATEANEGTVRLTGTVNRLRTKNRAERLASDIVGVHRVLNEIEVEYRNEEFSDMEIIHETQAAIRRSANLDQRDIRVHCQRAHVSLYGIVDSELEKQVAEWIADGVTGVVHVNNLLAVEPKWREKSDDAIKFALLRKLKYALLDKNDQIEVTVKNGTAILRGEVATWRQWQRVMDLALEAGARHPHNMLNVPYHPPHGASRIYVPR
ncbi:BON domain-containing protein [Novipirellula rosea]|uniref:BON domain-containing protein n=1 Tax=Novipirellula rosea TaxID=1031540 RepID=A0ABP8NKK6_9BACT